MRGQRRARRSGGHCVAPAVLVVLVASGPSEPLVGTGWPLDVSPRSVEFLEVEVDDVESIDVTASNTTGAPLLIEAIRVVDDDNGGFSIVDPEPCQVDRVQAGESCTIAVEFHPVFEADFTAKLEFVTAEGTVEVPVHGIAESAVPGTEVEPTVPADTEPALPTAPPETLPPETAPTTTTTAVEVVTPSDRERLDECDRRANDARVQYLRAAEMTLGETERFVVTASIGAPPSGSGPDGTLGPDVTVAPAKLRCEVEARLRGIDFRIDPADYQPGSFLEEPSVTWSWDVVALQAGARTLSLEIRAVVYIDGRRVIGGPKLFESSISVTTRPEGLWDRSKRWSGEVVEHPLVSGFGSVLVVGGFAAGVWRKLLKRPWPWAPQKQGRRRAPPRRRGKR